MEAVTVSANFEVVITERVLREHHIRPGDKLAVIGKHGVLHLVPVLAMGKTKGIHPPVDLSDLRDRNDRY